MGKIKRGSSTVAPKSMTRQRFYKKAYLARRLNHIMGEKEMMLDTDGDGILKLHQCLAMICVKKVGSPEVVASHVIVPDPEGSSSHAKLYMCKNNDWRSEEKQHVLRILECLRKMRKEFTKESVASTGCQQLRKEIQNEICSYCETRLQQKIKLLLDMIDTGVSNTLKKPTKALFPDDKWYVWIKMRKKVKILRKDLENLAKDLRSETKSVGDKSKSCREWCIHQAELETTEILRNKAPKIYQRIQKVASYYESVDVLVNWAVGSEEYLKAFPVPEEPLFSKAVVEPAPKSIGTDWKAIAKACYGDKVSKRNMKRVEQQNPFLQQQVAEGPPKKLCLHAEMHVLDSLAKGSSTTKGKLQTPRYIGVSKLCCYLCYNCILIKNQTGSNIVVKGTHNKIYCRWIMPKSVSKKEVELLEAELDRANMQHLKTWKEDEDGHGTEESALISISPRFKDKLRFH